MYLHRTPALHQTQANVLDDAAATQKQWTPSKMCPSRPPHDEDRKNKTSNVGLGQRIDIFLRPMGKFDPPSPPTGKGTFASTRQRHQSEDR